MADAPEDVKIVAQAYGLLTRAKCSSDFFFTVGEKLYAMQPSADIAMALATKFQDQKNFEKANQYLREAYASETDPVGKEKLLVSIGMLEMATNDIPAAVESFRAAKQLNPDNAYVPFFLAQCYVSGATGEGLARQAIYWVAYDLMQQAIPLLEVSDPDRVDAARQLAAQYRAAWPTKEECFFNELNDGDNYVVNCGYARNVSTTVRARLQ
jgi:tetratricopeptide (TPR) repeat protein